ncbi:short-subunit dehydrogenase [Terracoccus luteus]|uniref:Short-subunit dehydrogenase n=1 Tax=Terracoccus luteus TaxID=53356 RepID=A0A495XZS3_9MICO|nr:SDR family NAD(P)-dependent oxidoreductase [Terracoccus luteus]RKT78809.1 short-subunit dehydrogenase [Terracoccus luteus]
MTGPDSSARRVVLVTGGSSGIGLATALRLARDGADLVLTARSVDALEAAARQCEAHGARVLVAPADVGDADAVDGAAEAALERFGRLDAVVHSAAALAYGRFEDVPREVFDAALTTTLLGTSNVCRTALRHFHATGRGRLVVVGSLLGSISTPYMSSYVTAKWGVHGLVRTLQIEARQTPGIEISLVAPGGVDTPVYRQAGTYLQRHGRPPPPVDPPEKVADAVVRCLERPSRERSVGLANGIVVAGFRLLPGVFDRLVTPLMRLGGIERVPVPDSPGNVLEPNGPGEAVHDRWNRWGGTRAVSPVVTPERAHPERSDDGPVGRDGPDGPPVDGGPR